MLRLLVRLPLESTMSRVAAQLGGVRRWRLALLPALLLFAAACETIHGSGKIVRTERSIDAFERIALESSGLVMFTQGDDTRLIVEADDNLLPELRTHVDGGDLVFSTRSGVDLVPTQPIRFYLQAPDLQGVKIDGGGMLDSKLVTTRRFEIDISGSGDVRIECLKAQQLSTRISGSGNVALRGDVERQELEIAGSGDYRAKDLKTLKGAISISGSGNAEVHVAEQLTVSVAGSGDVRIHGKPQLSSQVSGSGDVRSVD